MPNEFARNILETAADFVEKGWIQACIAVDDNDCPVLPSSPNAVAWSATGAIDRAAFYGHGPIIDENDVWVPVLVAAGITAGITAGIHRKHWRELLVLNWNDEPGRTAAEVIAVLRRAADLA